MEKNQDPSKFNTLTLGIDWAAIKHDWCLLDAQGKVLGQGVIAHTHQEISTLIRDCVSKLTSAGRLHVACESGNNAIGRFLRDFDRVDLHVIHPGSFACYRQARRNSKAKDDSSDAFLLGDYLRRHLDESPILGKGQECELEMICRLRRNEADNRADIYNRLTSTLNLIFPQLLSLMAIKTNCLLQVLALWPTLQDFQAATPEQITTALKGKKLRKNVIIKLVELHRDGRPFVTDPAVISGSRILVKTLVAHIHNYNTIIDELEQRIVELTQGRKLFELMRRLPGAGKALAPRLVASFSNLPEGMTFEEFVAMLGIAPVMIASGKSKAVKMRMSGRGFTCQTIFEFADQSWKKCAWAKEHYRAQRAKGNCHGMAVRSVAYKWLRIIWAMLRTQEPYDEARYLAARSTKRCA